MSYKRDDLPPPHEHLARKQTLVSRALKHERVCYAIVAALLLPWTGRSARARLPERTPMVGQMIPARRVAHSITSSARARKVGGIIRLRVLAVLRLMTSLNLVACWTGKSDG